MVYYGQIRVDSLNSGKELLLNCSFGQRVMGGKRWPDLSMGLMSDSEIWSNNGQIWLPRG